MSAVCDGCGKKYKPKRQRTDRANYCPSCQAERVPQQAAERRYRERQRKSQEERDEVDRSRLLTDLVGAADASCGGCGGLGKTRQKGDPAPPECPYCHGKGRQLTPGGAALLDFLKLWADGTKDETYSRIFAALQNRIVALEGRS